MSLFIQITLLFCHIGLGIISVFSGFVVLSSKKGFSRHVKFGLIFVWTMVSSSIIGSILELINYTEFFITFSAGILSCTLIASGLLTLKQYKLKTSNFGLSIAAVNFLNFISLVVIASFALNNNEGVVFGFPAGLVLTGSGKTAFSESIKESGILFLPEIVIFLLLIFCLVRALYFTKAKIKLQRGWSNV